MAAGATSATSATSAIGAADATNAAYTITVNAASTSTSEDDWAIAAQAANRATKDADKEQ